MINHFLSTLSVEQEDRILTTGMRPGDVTAPCLLGVAGMTPTTALLPVYGPRCGLPWGGLIQWEDRNSVGHRYDALCARFGTPRINAAIRNRILSNRAWRVLHERRMTEQQVAAWTAQPVELRRALLGCETMYQAFKVLDRTELSEATKCDIAGLFPLQPVGASVEVHP